MANNVFPDPLPVEIKGSIVSQSGAQFFEGIRDDVEVIFSRDRGPTDILRLVDVGSPAHAITLDPIEGRVVFSIPATPGAVCYHETDKKAKYEGGHMIMGGQTIEPNELPTGDGKIEWGFGEDDGAGDLLNAIGMGLDAIGVYSFRKKAGAYAHKVYENSPANSIPVGEVWENPLVGFDILKNNIMGPAFEWYGVASPHFFIADSAGRPYLVHVSRTAGRINGTTVPEPKMPMFLRIQGDSTTGQALSVATGCWRGGLLTNKLVQTAQRPDLTYVDVRAGGNVASNYSDIPLTSNASFTPDWVDLDQIIAISALVKSNVNSASGGVQFQFVVEDPLNPDQKPDIGATPNFIAPRSYNAAPNGQTFRVDKPAARWGRVVYANGVTAQSSFLLAVNLETSSLSTDIQVAAPDNTTTVSITVGTSPVQLDSTALIGRLSWEVYSDATNSNNQRVFVGFSNTVAASGVNRGRPVENGADWKMDLSLNKQVWAVASAPGMTVQFTQVAK